MNARIQGTGMVTPLGRGTVAVRDAVIAGARPEPQSLENPFDARAFPVFRVDPKIVDDAARMPRLRRSGVISHFAVAAALDALKDANCDGGDERLALVFATTNGGVVHTRRFFDEIANSGTQAGSPLLFPETVYNAPASHIAAILGITGVVTTIVNDATAGVDAIATACELLAANACDRCLVVAAEEADWIVCEACATWGLADAGAAPFGEGAAALVLGREERGPKIERICASATFRSIVEARQRFVEMETGRVDIVVTSASGRKFDAAEAALALDSRRLAPRFSLGEAFASSTIMQVVLASISLGESERALVPVTGFHGQLAALTIVNGKA
ncbi:MAG: beta-ketoacyl synthase N-terminal-like domain-containing protein [Chthoniobacterales bacterium]